MDKEILKRLERLIGRVPNVLPWIERALEELERVAGSPASANKIALYEFTTEALRKDLGVAAEDVHAWLLGKFAESDEKVLDYFRRPEPARLDLAGRLEEALVGLEVTFRLQQESTTRWERELTAYVRVADAVKRHRQTDELDWSDLPEEVREARLGDQDREVTFKLVPAPANDE